MVVCSDMMDHLNYSERLITKKIIISGNETEFRKMFEKITGKEGV